VAFLALAIKSAPTFKAMLGASFAALVRRLQAVWLNAGDSTHLG
jgi:hypothetical protein